MCPHTYARILVAPDKFKGSLTAGGFCDVAESVLHRIMPAAKIVCRPLADGGEGSLDCFAAATGAKLVEDWFTGPDGTPVRGVLAVAGDTAFVEMSATAGLALTKIKNPLYTTTLGVGEQILRAVAEGARRIFLAIGGSATNDAGCGMAAALGWKFLDGEDREFVPTGGTLDRIRRIIEPDDFPALSVTTLCDVKNPLFGTNGAAYVYAPQKGATPDDVRTLDENLIAFNALCAAQGKDMSALEGGGAAGGLGAGSVFFLGARLQGGAETFFGLTGIYDEIAAADLIVTGEGKIDAQTLHGKTVGALHSASRGKPFVAFCGAAEGNPPFECVQINRPELTLEQNVARTALNLEEAIVRRFQ